MTAKPRLELTWIGKDRRPRLEPRILLEDPARSHHAPHRVTDHDLFDNRLLFGDNLLALKALEAEFAGRVKCIYIDPPYNTGSAFEHYDDGIEHSVWLSLMRDRLVLLRKLLRDDGHIFVQIDNNEMAYLKMLLDEVFGRSNFINDIVWKRRGGSANPVDRLNNVTDFILWYSKSQEYVVNHIYSLEDENTQTYIQERFTNVDDNGRRFMKSPIQSPNLRPNLKYEYKGYAPPPKGWSISQDLMERWEREGKLWFPQDKTHNITRKIYLDEYRGQPIGNLWTDIKVINPMSRERLGFDGQKPEAIIRRIITLTTNPGDLVLDSFAGSGTTGAVAHKMGRRWIMVELGDHIHTHIVPRLTKVIDGQDPGGVTEAVGWKGGGGFRYFRLAPSLLEQDAWGRLVVNPAFNPAMLAEAVSKLEGFRYEPSDTLYWQHGASTERDFLYVTTASLSHDQLQQLSDEVGPDRTLLVCCGAFRAAKTGYPNLTVKKIPGAVLDRCEWGKDDYSPTVQSLPAAPPPEGQQALALTEPEDASWSSPPAPAPSPPPTTSTPSPAASASAPRSARPWRSSTA